MSIQITKTKRATRVHDKTLLNQRLRFNEGWHDGFTEPNVQAGDNLYVAGWRLGRSEAAAGLPHGTSAAAWARFVAGEDWKA